MNNTNYNIQVVQADVHEKQVIRNLIQFYQYDASEHSHDDPSPFGLFDYNYLDHYWTPHGRDAEGRAAYLIRVNDSLAGFALINDHSILNKPDTKTIAEFFIMRKWRKKGVGRQAALTIFDTHPGLWEVKQEKENKIAQKFWQSVIQSYTGGAYTRLESHPPAWDGPLIYFSKPLFTS
ncbi:GNAT family N-acetyltransferase [Paenibacillus senegalensis]|uniref:GNAT family N-acetyltransferase n=1 Tax=Paenibacillus senegalensis TaxID=1465766 RepID=UPI00028A02AA|nr:GNAT family N-acetyltransferase [Paenibacillus senegalensis]